MPVPRAAALTIALCLAALAGAVILRLLVGGPTLAWPDSPAFLEIRLTRVWSGAVVGAALAIAGVKLQCMLRNPLASPDLLGLASGAGLGVMVAALLASRAAGTIQPDAGIAGPTGIAALVGSMAALAIVYLLSQKRGLLDPVSLILVGVVVAIMCSAASMFIEHLLPDRGAAARRWLLGALRDDVSTGQLTVSSLIVLLWLGVGLAMGRAMDAAALGEDEARSIGVRLSTLRTALFISSGVLAAVAVTLAGPIGFVGLICPHLVRLGAGPAHRPLLIGSALAGAALVVGADALVKAFNFGAGRLPIGVMTTLVGGPLLIVLLRGTLPRQA